MIKTTLFCDDDTTKICGSRRNGKIEKAICIATQSQGYLAQQSIYFKENVFCPQGYFVSSVGLDGEKIKHYVDFQGRQDLGQLRLEL